LISLFWISLDLLHAPSYIQDVKWEQMSTKWKATAILIPWAIAVGYVVYLTFIAGRTGGPDFIRAFQNRNLAVGEISSIEVVEPAIGHTPFTAQEYDSLTRRAKIDSPDSIRRMLVLLMKCQPGNIQQNHPATTYRTYLKVNTPGGFYWLYCDLHQDDSISSLTISANTRNATNPNGGGYYHLEDFSELLTILGRTNNPAADVAVNGSQQSHVATPVVAPARVRSRLYLALDIVGNTAFFGFLAWLYIRARRQRPRFEKSDVIYQEWFASGASQRNLFTKFAGARKCLRLVVTWDYLWVTSWFPFSLFTPVFDLEHVIPLGSIASVRYSSFFGSSCPLLTFTDGKGRSHTIRLWPKNPVAFVKSLGVQTAK
jgi:hypothetical protein